MHYEQFKRATFNPIDPILHRWAILCQTDKK